MSIAIRGLKNRGNTCYINAVLQFLAGGKLRSYLEQKHRYLQSLNKGDLLATKVLHDLKALQEEIRYPNRLPPFEPSVATHSKLMEKFTAGEQQDAHEFFQVLMNQLLFPETHSPSSPSLTNILVEQFEKRKEQETKRTAFPYSGLMGSSLYFPNCSHRASLISDFIDLSLSIPVKKDCTLEQCLEDWTGAELIEDVECSQCKAHQEYSEKDGSVKNGSVKNGTEKNGYVKNGYVKNGYVKTVRGPAKKQLKIVRPPESLCIHIHRLVTDHWSHVMKVDHHVVFQQQLDLSPYCVHTDPLYYQLISVVVHNGFNGAGHYSTYRMFQNSWLHLSDEVVRSVKSNEVMNSKAYLLLYEKIPQ